jgi:hypothetical protein
MTIFCGSKCILTAIVSLIFITLIGFFIIESPYTNRLLNRNSKYATLDALIQSSSKDIRESILSGQEFEFDNQIMSMLDEYKRIHSKYALINNENKIKYCDRNYILGVYSCPKQVGKKFTHTLLSLSPNKLLLSGRKSYSRIFECFYRSFYHGSNISLVLLHREIL